MRASLATLVLLVVGAVTAAGEETLIPKGAVFKYLDDGSDQGTSWSGVGFDDSSWAAGPAELGYGDGDEATRVSYGPDLRNKYVTTWFRHSFSVTDPSTYRSLVLRILRDDGAVVWLNGVEVFRTNMPAGAIDYLTTATSAVAGAQEREFQRAPLDPTPLQVGSNVLAVEIHQFNGASSDISLDLELVGRTFDDPILVTRGPYLQRGTPRQVTVRWRTDLLLDSRVSYGADPGRLDRTVDDPTPTREHEVRVTGLEPGRQYYYAIGTTSEVLAGADDEHVFVTAPLAGTVQPVRIWAIGDSGTADFKAAAVRDAWLDLAGAGTTDVWLMLGDNAYPGGTDHQYQYAVFEMYPMLLRRTVLWPSIGNHDRADSSTWPYYDAFTLPSGGEAGGLPSGTEAYYSFDHASVHFVCLDSCDSDRQPGSAMLTWLEQDLAATRQEWIVAYWHHPPYSKGSHDSDDPLDSGGRLFEMRENVLPILEDWGVDLVLCGHSHSYERSFLLDGHHGTSDTLTGAMVLDGGDGRLDGDGAYVKASRAPAPHEGAVYVVAGSSGKTSGGSLDHPAMFFALNELGSMVLEIDGNRLDAGFLRETGVVDDWFTIVKGPIVPDANPRSVTATFADGTAGALEPRRGAWRVSGERLEILGPSRFLLSAQPYLAPTLLARVLPGMTPGAAVGLQWRAAAPEEDEQTTGPGSLRLLVRHVPGGLRATLERPDGTIARGPAVPFDVARQPFTLRVETTGGQLRCFAENLLLLSVPALAPRPGYASLLTRADRAGNSRVVLEYVLVRDVGEVPEVTVDRSGDLWISLLEEDLITGFDTGSFAFHLDGVRYDLAAFLRLVLPRFDHQEGLDPHHVVLGLREEHLSPGTRIGMEYRGGFDEDAVR